MIKVINLNEEYVVEYFKTQEEAELYLLFVDTEDNPHVLD